MSIEDYLPSIIKHDKLNGYIKNTKYLSFQDYYPSRIFLRLEITISKNKILVEYVPMHPSKYEDVIIYDGICNDYDTTIKECISSFNTKIGDITEFVDTYRKRNIILLNL